MSSPGVPENSVSKPLVCFSPDGMATPPIKLQYKIQLATMTSSSYQTVEFFYSPVILCCLLSTGLYSEFQQVASPSNCISCSWSADLGGSLVLIAHEDRPEVNVSEGC